MGFKTISITDESHAKLAADAKKCGRLTLYGMLEAWGRGFDLLSPEQQFAAIRGTEAPTDAGLLNTGSDDTLARVCNLIQRAALNLDDFCDRALADGKLDPTECEELRRLLKHKNGLLCKASSHAAEPQPLITNSN
jgi:hypothetical protein